MTQSQRSLAFFSAMLLTFGISGLDFSQLSFEHNKVEYVAITGGLILAIFFIVQKIRN